MPALRIELSETLARIDELVVHPPASILQHSILVSHRAIGESGWGLMALIDEAGFYTPARLHAGFAALSIALLVLVGSLISYIIMRSLTQRLSRWLLPATTVQYSM